MAKKITKIVLTGGPAAGKTTLISRILHEFRQEDGWRVITIPETATELISGFGTVREEVASVLSMMLEALRDLILLKKSDSAPLLFYADRSQAQDLSQASPVAALNALMQATEYTRTRILRNANVKLALSELLLSDVPTAQR